MIDEETEFAFFNKALREKNIYHLGMNKGEYVPLRSRVLTSAEIEEENIWGKENRNIKKGKIRVIRTPHLARNVDAIKRIKHGMSRDTLTLVELQGIAFKQVADPIVRAIADILPHTTILCLNLGEMSISDDALEYLLGKIKEKTCILGALFIETITKELKKEFIKALGDNRKKIEFLYRIADEKRYSYLENYTSAWWNLCTRPITAWQTRFETSQFELVQRGILFEEGYYYAIAEDEDEDSTAR